MLSCNDKFSVSSFYDVFLFSNCTTEVSASQCGTLTCHETAICVTDNLCQCPFGYVGVPTADGDGCHGKSHTLFSHCVYHSIAFCI